MMMNREAREELYDPKNNSMRPILKQKRLSREELKQVETYMDKHKVSWDEAMNTLFYDPKRKRKRSAWLSFVIAHKNMRTKKGLLDLKAISKLWKLKKTAIRKHKQ